MVQQYRACVIELLGDENKNYVVYFTYVYKPSCFCLLSFLAIPHSNLKNLFVSSLFMLSNDGS